MNNRRTRRQSMSQFNKLRSLNQMSVRQEIKDSGVPGWKHTLELKIKPILKGQP